MVSEGKKGCDNYLLHQIFDFSLSAIITVDEQGIITSWNNAAENIFGWSSQEAVGRFNPTVPEGSKDYYLKIIGEPHKNMQFTAQRKDGAKVEALLSTAPLTEDAGNIVGAVGVLNELTGRGEDQKKLEEYELFLEAIMDDSPFAMWVSDKKGVIQKTNKSLRKILNLSDDQIIGKYNVLTDLNLKQPGIQSKVEDVFKKLKPARFTIFWEADRAGAEFIGGRDLWIDASLIAVKDELGELKNVVCQWADITKQKKAVDHYQSLLESLVDPLVISDLDGTILYANEATVELLGKPKESIEGTSISDADFLTNKSKAVILANISKYKLTGEDVKSYDIEIVSASGEIRIYEISSNDLIEGGEHTGWIVSLRDVTNREKIRG
ncbi:MAG: PAS domain S-box protein, partial [Candidatus Altiarchaeales archaeon]|nr:PAS domain S-box protein [Candidatus Altiarchaeales archaeon]